MITFRCGPPILRPDMHDSPTAPEEPVRKPDTDRYGWKFNATLVLTGIAVSLLVALILWIAGDVFLLMFAGLLLAIFLINLSKILEKNSSLPYGWSLACVLGILLIAFGLLLALFATRVAGETDELMKTLQTTWQQAGESFEKYDWFSRIVNASPGEPLRSFKGDWFSRIAGVFSTTIGILSSTILILFIGVFIAADPKLYRRGMLYLIPLSGRHRVNEVLDELHHKMWWWIIGQTFSMFVVGVATGVGLWMLGIPFAATLGLLSGLLTFIPNFGPVLSAVPAVVLGFADGAMQAIYVVVLYLGIQAAESNLLTPLIQQRNVKLPPVLNVSAQILMGVTFGVVGLIVAAPLAVVAMTLVQRFYIEDYLGDWTLSSKSEDESTRNSASI